MRTARIPQRRGGVGYAGAEKTALDLVREGEEALHPDPLEDRARLREQLAGTFRPTVFGLELG